MAEGENQESRIRGSIRAGRCYRELDLWLCQREELLKGYYLGKNRHPDDYNETIDKWDEID